MESGTNISPQWRTCNGSLQGGLSVLRGQCKHWVKQILVCVLEFSTIRNTFSPGTDETFIFAPLFSALKRMSYEISFRSKFYSPSDIM